jgi:hypothetical protein
MDGVQKRKRRNVIALLYVAYTAVVLVGLLAFLGLL